MSLSNFEYQEIMQMYEDRRLSYYHLHEQRKKEIYQKIPRIRDLDRQMAANSVALGRKLIAGDDPALRETCRQQNRQITLEKQKLLSDQGYPENYLDPIYNCTQCKDTGYIGQERCRCFQQAVINLLYSNSNMEKLLERENFHTFREDYYSDQITSDGLPSPRANIRKILQHCHGFINRFPNHENILFQGSTGVGKTFLSHCIAKEIMDRGYTCAYTTAFQLFDYLAKHTFRKEREEDTERSLNMIFQCDLLIIDDLGTEMVNKFVISQLFQCLNERLIQEKSTIISTNLSVREFRDTYSERIFSRVIEHYSWHKIYGDDIRFKKSNLT